MMQDIIYEIVIFLYLCPEENGGALLAKKIIISEKSYQKIGLLKLEKPVVIEIENNETKILRFGSGSVVYWGDGTNSIGNSDNLEQIHKYGKKGKYIVKIFNHAQSIFFYEYGLEIHSIEEITDLSGLFMESNIADKNIGQKWDASRVTDMSHMFSGCTDMNLNVGKNWNVSQVKNMESMFEGCESLDKNIGKNWDVSNVSDMSNMFWFCILLNRNVGKKWNVSNVVNMSSMFSGCINLNKNIGKNWDVLNVTNMTSMFFGCINISKNIGKNWMLNKKLDMYCMFDGCNKVPSHIVIKFSRLNGYRDPLSFFMSKLKIF